MLISGGKTTTEHKYSVTSGIKHRGCKTTVNLQLKKVTLFLNKSIKLNK